MLKMNGMDAALPLPRFALRQWSKEHRQPSTARSKIRLKIIAEGKGLILNTSQPYHPSWTHDNHDHRFYYDCTEKAPSAAAMSEADAKRLWEVSERLVGLDKREDGWTGQNKDEVADESQAVD